MSWLSFCGTTGTNVIKVPSSVRNEIERSPGIYLDVEIMSILESRDPWRPPTSAADQTGDW